MDKHQHLKMPKTGLANQTDGRERVGSTKMPCAGGPSCGVPVFVEVRRIYTAPLFRVYGKHTTDQTALWMPFVLFGLVPICSLWVGEQQVDKRSGTPKWSKRDLHPQPVIAGRRDWTKRCCAGGPSSGVPAFIKMFLFCVCCAFLVVFTVSTPRGGTHPGPQAFRIGWVCWSRPNVGPRPTIGTVHEEQIAY